MEEYISKQLDESYNGKINLLLEKWRNSYPAEDAGKFCQDGLVLKYKNKESGYDINSEWEKSPRKIMFLLKDCPDEWGYDARTLLVGGDDERSQTFAEETRKIKKRFFKNIARILYGLSVMTNDYKGEELAEDMKNSIKLINAFNEIPFAYIECKKIAGGKSCIASVLSRAIERDHIFLTEEIDILKPNIIVCCDSQGVIFDKMVTYYFNGSVPDEDSRWEYDFVNEDGTKGGFNCKLYFYKKENVLLFNSYHPTALKVPDWKVYEKVFSPFRQYFSRYHAF